MGSSTRRAAAALTALAVLPGCVTGHLLDAARRRERPLAIDAAVVDGRRLVVAYTAVVTDDLGAPLGRRQRRAAIDLTAPERENPGAGEPAVVRLADGTSLRGRPLALRERPGGAGQGPALLVERTSGGLPGRLVLDEPGAAARPVPAGALVETWTAPWAWPLLPVGLAVDLVVDPVLLFFAPAVILMGD
jgi:hypothetical protein